MVRMDVHCIGLLFGGKLDGVTYLPLPFDLNVSSSQSQSLNEIDYFCVKWLLNVVMKDKGVVIEAGVFCSRIEL